MVSLVFSAKDGELLGLAWGMMDQVTNMICPDQYSKGSDTIWYLTWRKRCWEFFEFFVKPRVVVGKYREICRLWVGESTNLLRTNWKMSLT